MNKTFEIGQVFFLTLFVGIIFFFLGIGFGTSVYIKKHSNNQKQIPIVGEQYYYVDKGNPFDQDTIKIIITDVKKNKDGEIWVQYKHYYSKDDSIMGKPWSKDWKFIEGLFEKYN